MLRALRIFYPLIFLAFLGQMARAQEVCAGREIINIDFDSGSEPFPSAQAPFFTTLNQVVGTPSNAGEYALTNDVNNIAFPFANTFWYKDVQDSRTPNGYFMVVNANFSDDVLFSETIDFCAGSSYEFRIDAISLIQEYYDNTFRNPQLIIFIDGVRQGYNNMSHNEQWETFKFPYTVATSGPKEVRIVLDVPTGDNHDIAFDNLKLIECQPELELTTPPTVCYGETVTVESTINSAAPSSLEWQFLGSSGWETISNTNAQLSVTLDESNTGMYRAIYREGACIELMDSVEVKSFATEEGAASINATVCEGQTYFFEGQSYDVGLHQKVYINRFGCDSTVQIEVVETPSSYATINQQVCSGFEFEGSLIYSDTSIQRTFSASTSCDSTINYIFSVRPLTSQNETIFLCMNEMYNGIQISSDTIIQSDLVDINGCDSVHITNIYVRKPDSTLQEVGICAGDSLVLPNQVVKTSGRYEYSLQNKYGCDSTVIIQATVYEAAVDSSYLQLKADTVINGVQVTGDTLIIFETTTSNGCPKVEVVEISFKKYFSITNRLEACDVLTFKGQEYRSNTRLLDTIQVDEMTDSIITTEIVIHSSFVSDTAEVQLCAGEEYSFFGQTISEAGIYEERLATVDGCDSIQLVQVILNTPDTINIADSICAGDSLVLPNQIVKTSGTYEYVLQNAAGCDSVVRIEATFYKAETDTQYIRLTADTVINGIQITGDTIIEIEATTAYGCLKVDVLDITLKKIFEQTNRLEACDVLTFKGQEYRSNTRLLDTIQVDEMTDSIITTEIVIHSSFMSDTAAVQLCAGEEYSFLGQTISEAGIYEERLATVDGCDSILFVQVILNTLDTTNIADSICAGDSLVLPNQIVKTSGTYEYVLQNAAGCDSVVRIEATFYEAETDTQYIRLTADTVINGIQITGDTIIEIEATTAYGCPKVDVLDITFKKIFEQTNRLEACDILTFKGQEYRSNTRLVDTVEVDEMTDSIITTEIVIHSSFDSDTSVIQICANSSYTFFGQDIKTSGVYQEVLETANGCDSNIYVEVIIEKLDTVAIVDTICAGDSILLGASYYSQEGTYQERLTNKSGCDSLVVLNLEVIRVEPIEVDTVVCAGSTITYAGAEYGVGNHTIEQALSTGCIQTIRLKVEERQEVTATIALEICAGDSIEINGKYEKVSGNYVTTSQNEAGCDSVTTIILSVVEPLEQIKEVIINGDTIVEGEVINKDTTIRDVFQSLEGCDSIIITVFRSRTIVSDSTLLTDCKPIEVDGKVYASDTILTNIFNISPIKDSIHLTQIDIVEQSTVDTVRLTYCAGKSVLYEGRQYTAGSYQIQKETESNCIIDEVVIVSERPKIEVRESITLCQGETIELDGQTISRAGEYQSLNSSASGCDSLTIYEVAFEGYKMGFSSHTVCEGTVFQDRLINVDTSFMDTLSSAAGCDSIHTFFLALKDAPSLGIELSAKRYCKGDSVRLKAIGAFEKYRWSTGEDTKEITVSKAGKIALEGVDADGCRAAAKVEISDPNELEGDVAGTDPICFGEESGTIEFNAITNATGTVQFSINNGLDFQSDGYFSGLMHGQYFTVARDSLGCLLKDTIVLNQPEYLEVGFENHKQSAEIEAGGSHLIEVYTNKEATELETILWTPSESLTCDSCLKTIATPVTDTKYSIFLVDTAGCTNELFYELRVEADYTVNFPNVFSPNDDGQNDIFKPVITGNFVQSVELFSIFDRWGETLIVQSNRSPESNRLGWDGRYKGHMMNPGVFVYYAEVRLKDGTLKTFKGDVTIVR